MSTCPTPETLGRLAYDSSSGSRFAALDAHVQVCTNCQDVLERLAGDAPATTEHGPARLAEPDIPPSIPGFVIEGVLGRGGMGVVYRAWQPQLARHVAIKIGRASFEIGAEDRRRWLREARAIGRVRHRNVVQLHEAGEQDGHLYLVLDLITGGSLAERLSGPLPARVAAELMAVIARAVDQIHRAGMLHLDIKPSNILLDGPPEGPWDQVVPMLADFGIARAGDDPGATANGPIGVGGTPSFMAPEQTAGGRAAIGPHSDVFALGATLYTLLTGRPPFQAASVIETLDLLRTSEPAPPRTLVPGLPRDLETIALTCLRKDPQRRYLSAAALADDLQRWLAGFPIRARPVSKIEHAGRWCRRRPALALLLVVLAFTVTSSLLGLFLLWRQTESERVRAERALALAIDSDKATSEAIHDLVDLLATTVDSPQMVMSERLDEASRIVRDLTAKLRQDPRFATANLIAICTLERKLAEYYRRGCKYAESRVLLLDILEVLERQRGAASDPDIDLEYANIVMELAMVAIEQQDSDAAIVCLERAEEAMSGWVQDPRRLKAIIIIHRARTAIATQLGRRGLKQEQRQLLETHVRMLEHLDDSGKGDPTIGLLAAMTRARLADDGTTITALRAAIQRFPADQRFSVWLEAILSDWILSAVNPQPFSPVPSGKPGARLDPEAQADRLIGTLEPRCEVLGVGHCLLAAVALRLGNMAAVRGAELRKAHLLDDARWTAACLSALARKLVRKDSSAAAFHLLLSQAFEQESKNAWQVLDYVAIKEALRKALGEARTALYLDPRNLELRLQVAGLQDKLVGAPSGPLTSR